MGRNRQSRFKLYLAILLLALISIAMTFIMPAWYWRNRSSLKRLNDDAIMLAEQAGKVRDWQHLVELLGSPMGFVLSANELKIYAPELAADELVKGGPAAGAVALEVGLKSSNAQIRFMSIRVLGRLGDMAYAQSLLHVLRYEHDPQVLIYGAEALCALGMTQDAKPIIKEALEDWSHPDYLVGHDFKRYHYTCVMAEYLNRRYHLGLEVPDELYKRFYPVDDDKYPRSKK